MQKAPHFVHRLHRLPVRLHAGLRLCNAAPS